MIDWVAATTERLKLGSAVMQMPARMPTMTAMTVATHAALERQAAVQLRAIPGHLDHEP